MDSESLPSNRYFEGQTQDKGPLIETSKFLRSDAPAPNNKTWKVLHQNIFQLRVCIPYFSFFSPNDSPNSKIIRNTFIPFSSDPLNVETV